MFNGFRRLWLTISSSFLKPTVVFWVFFRTAPFYGGKIGFKLTSLSVFKTPCVTAYQRYIVSSCILGLCVLLRGYSRVPEHVRTTPGPAVDRGGQAGENNVCWAFQQRHLINRFWGSINHPHMSDPCSCTASVFECVCVALVLDACRMVGIQSRLLNYICTKTTGLHTRRASLPASQQVSQPPDAQPYQYFSVVLLFISHVSVWFVRFSSFKHWRESLRSDLWFFSLQRQHIAR